jgi:hypothetical protein
MVRPLSHPTLGAAAAAGARGAALHSVTDSVTEMSMGGDDATGDGDDVASAGSGLATVGAGALRRARGATAAPKASSARLAARRAAPVGGLVAACAWPANGLAGQPKRPPAAPSAVMPAMSTAWVIASAMVTAGAPR